MTSLYPHQLPDDLSELSYASVDHMPVDVDWQDLSYPEWEYYEAVSQGDNEPHLVYPRDLDQDDLLYERCAGPMMNSAYPIDLGFKDLNDCAEAIAGLPLCIVDFHTGASVSIEEETALALTGGGMDLTWEIVEAYMRLGHLPPKHFTRLPRMAGRGTSDTDRRIIEACRKTIDVTMNRSASRLEHLDRFSPLMAA